MMPNIAKARIKRPALYRRRSTSERVAFGIAFLWFFLYSLSIIFLFTWGFLSSLKDNREFFRATFALPERWLFSNYLEAFKVLNYQDTNFIGMIFNSLWLTFGMLFIGQMMAALIGYIFARYSFKIKNFLFTVVIFTMIVPLLGSGAAGYKLTYALGLNDSPLYLIKSFGALNSGMLIYMGVFKGLPKEYMEASFIDGGGHLYTYFRIMLPMILGPMSALFITGFIGGWNDYMTPLMYLGKYPTLASGLYFYRAALKFESNEPLYFAGVMMCAAPVLAVFLIFQNKFMENVTIGGLKG
jgi:ABC-type glycerol-3-phosphate transport system permease component